MFEPKTAMRNPLTASTRRAISLAAITLAPAACVLALGAPSAGAARAGRGLARRDRAQRRPARRRDAPRGTARGTGAAQGRVVPVHHRRPGSLDRPVPLAGLRGDARRTGRRQHPRAGLRRLDPRRHPHPHRRPLRRPRGHHGNLSGRGLQGDRGRLQRGRIRGAPDRARRLAGGSRRARPRPSLLQPAARNQG